MLSARSAGKRLNTWLREWSVLLGLLLLAFVPVLKWMYERWIAADSYTSHGFLVPLISGYFVYTQRKELLALPRRPALSGLPILIFGILVFIASVLLRV